MSPLITTTGITFRTVLFYILTFIGIVLFVGYVLFQARFMLEGPQIFLTSQNSGVQTEALIHLEGHARNIVRMTLNGRQIYTDTSGNFNEALVLENGYTIATLQAEDRYGRTTILTQAFVYKKTDDVVSINQR